VDVGFDAGFVGVLAGFVTVLAGFVEAGFVLTVPPLGLLVEGA